MAVVDHGKLQKHNDALKKIISFFKRSLSVKQTTVEGADAIKLASDNQVPTSSRQHTIESLCRTDTKSFPYENNCECYKKLASKMWPVLFTVIFFVIHSPLFWWKIKKCFDRFFPQ